MHEERDQDIWWVLKPHATHSLPPSPSALTLWPHKPVCEWCDSRVGRHWPAWCMRMRARMCVCVCVCYEDTSILCYYEVRSKGLGKQFNSSC